MDDGRLQILECTLRDGGRGLEDCKKNNLSYTEFTQNDYTEIVNLLTKSNVDIIELGIIALESFERKGFAVFHSMEDISKEIPKNKFTGQMYAAMFGGADVGLENVPNYKEGFCEMVRVILRYSELRKSLDFCVGLAEKGYKVAIQPMLTMRYTDEELQQIIDVANDIDAYAVYIVDSYGYMMDTDVNRLIYLFDSKLSKSIRLGFHAHNHINMAFNNALIVANYKTHRKIILDACAMGMGQGAGNLQSELIIGYLKYRYNFNKYQYNYILDVCEIIEKYVSENMWGYTVSKMLTALHKTAHNYAVNLRHRYNYSYAEIDKLLSKITPDMQHRYTIENLDELINRNKKSL